MERNGDTTIIIVISRFQGRDRKETRIQTSSQDVGGPATKSVPVTVLEVSGEKSRSIVFGRVRPLSFCFIRCCDHQSTKGNF
jgi:hypothetical protein